MVYKTKRSGHLWCARLVITRSGFSVTYKSRRRPLWSPGRTPAHPKRSLADNIVVTSLLRVRGGFQTPVAVAWFTRSSRSVGRRLNRVNRPDGAPSELDPVAFFQWELVHTTCVRTCARPFDRNRRAGSYIIGIMHVRILTETFTLLTYLLYFATELCLVRNQWRSMFSKRWTRPHRGCPTSMVLTNRTSAFGHIALFHFTLMRMTMSY